MWQLPKEMYAEISRWLPNDYAGGLMRKMARDVIIRDVRNNKTYGNGLLHSFNDEPAAIRIDGICTWYLNGKIHRENKPAIISSEYKLWYLNDKLHRVDGPAVICQNGYMAWYLNGKLHRVNGPAVIESDGTTEYWLNGQRHQKNEPVLINASGSCVYFLHCILQLFANL